MEPSDSDFDVTRRTFCQLSALAPLVPLACSKFGKGVAVNDVHSQLNKTRVRRVFKPNSSSGLRTHIRNAVRNNRSICVSGSRHSMGGQQFRSGAPLIDARNLNRVLSLDRDNGIARVEAGIQWPELIQTLNNMQSDADRPWTIRQKQTGADRLTIGGAVSVNAHGRGLTWQPIVQDIEAVTLVTPDGSLVTCSRNNRSRLFRLVVGGYGLFGAIYSVRLRLMRRTKLQRVVEIKHVDDVMDAFDRRINDGFLYGDFQFSVDDVSPGFLKRGVFSCYRPVDPSTPVPDRQKELNKKQWLRMIQMAHEDEDRLFEFYTDYYRSTSGQVYWSDHAQLSTYIRGYHQLVEEQFSNGIKPGSEMITELYVPRQDLPGFMEDVAGYLRERSAEVVYGTVRLIKEDTDTFLPWARDDFACVVLNLHVNHGERGLKEAKTTFRGLIDRTMERGGTFFLTYHPWATEEQVKTCYPEMHSFLKEKQKFDPDETFQSDWYARMKSNIL